VRRRVATATMPWPHLIEELTRFRDYYGARVRLALEQDPPDYAVAKAHEPKVEMSGRAIVVIEKLLDQNHYLSEVLKNRVVVALSAAKDPEWVPTHRHYKGKLYRVTGRRMDAEHEELEEKVEYDDREGGRFVLSRRKFEGRLESGKPRYEYIYADSTMLRRNDDAT
jgi:hypothetical protein